MLIDNGWKMRDIDEMDFLGYLHVRAWKSQREHERAHPKPRKAYIDEVWPMGQ